MESFCTKAKIILILTAVICLSPTLSFGGQAYGSPEAAAAALDLGEASEGFIQMAQSAAPPESGPEAKRDTVYIQVPAAASTETDMLSAEDKALLTERRDHFQRMQRTGFGLMMGGIGSGALGIMLMVTGASQMNRDNGYDAYGNERDSDKGAGTFFIGYIAVVLGMPGLITPGIILNRVGNHKRARFQRQLDQADGGLGLGIGPNSLKLTYRF